MEKPEFLYKYRSLENLERFLGIVIEQKLYATLYNKMNDPMEGYFQHSSSVANSLIRSIKSEKNKRYICSLSKKPNIGLMWTHYADENRGCCLEVEVTSNDWSRHEVRYDSNIQTLDEYMSVEEILSVKSHIWSYEEEVRYICPVSSSKSQYSFLPVRINKIIFGYKVKKETYEILRRVILAINKDIEIEMMGKKELDYGYL